MSTPSNILEAHKHCANHRKELEMSEICGCFYCCSVFGSLEIKDWCDEDEGAIGRTAMCPKCGIDSVIGSASNFPIETVFLESMKAHWFGERKGMSK